MFYFPTFDNKTSSNTVRVSRVERTQRQAADGCLLSVDAATPSPSCVRYKNSKIALFTVPEVKVTHNINKLFNCDRCHTKTIIETVNVYHITAFRFVR